LTVSYTYRFTPTQFVLSWRTADVGALQIDGIALPLRGSKAYPLRTHTFILTGASLDGSETKIAVAALTVLADCKARVNEALVDLPALACAPTVTPTKSPTPTATATSTERPESPTATRTATRAGSAVPITVSHGATITSTISVSSTASPTSPHVGSPATTAVGHQTSVTASTVTPVSLASSPTPASDLILSTLPHGTATPTSTAGGA
jgi:hypothetical protein